MSLSVWLWPPHHLLHGAVNPENHHLLGVGGPHPPPGAGATEKQVLLGVGDPHPLPGDGAKTTTENQALLGVGDPHPLPGDGAKKQLLLGVGDQAHQAGPVHQAGQDPNLLPAAGTKQKYHQVIYLLLMSAHIFQQIIDQYNIEKW